MKSKKVVALIVSLALIVGVVLPGTLAFSDEPAGQAQEAAAAADTQLTEEKTQEVKTETPKTEEVKAEAPKAETPKAETPKAEEKAAHGTVGGPRTSPRAPPPPASLTPDGEDPGPPAPLPQGMSSIHPAGSGAEGFHPWSVFWFTSLMLSHLPGEP